MFAAKLIDLGSQFEVVGYYPDALKKEVDGQLGSSKDAYKKDAYLSEEYKERDNLNRAVRRAKTKIRRLAKRYDMQYMWTLTFAKQQTIVINPVTKKQYIYDVSSWDDAWKLFSRFIARCRKVGLKFDYIAVAEIQEERLKKYGEKVFHFHMATNLYIPQNSVMLKKYNFSHKDKMFFSLNDFWNFGHSKATKKRTNKFCSNYMIKYMTKAFEDIEIKSRQRYRVSQGMVIPVSKLEFEDHNAMIAWIKRDCKCVLNKKSQPVSKYLILGDSLEIWWFLLDT